jgi:two-component system nitrate/nitrite response regulator NarL
MNFLVSGNHETVLQFQGALAERGEVLWLVTFAELLARVPGSGSGIAVLDVTTTGFEGDSMLKQLKRLNPELKILLAGAKLPPNKELAALAAGAMGCCSSDLGAEQVSRILNIVEDGGVWISNAALPQLLQRLRSKTSAVAASTAPATTGGTEAELAELTQREREIARMVASGDSNKIIARKLNITDRTVKAHLTTVFQKLNVRDRLQLALYVNKNGH